MKKPTRKKRLGTKQVRNRRITGTKLEDGMHRLTATSIRVKLILFVQTMIRMCRIFYGKPRIQYMRYGQSLRMLLFRQQKKKTAEMSEVESVINKTS